MQFTIEEKIQESTFTSVYRAFDPVLQRRILLKVLHKHHAADPDLHQRFMREAQACAALRSEYIVQVYTLSEYENCPAIVMEFVDGISLKQFIADPSNRSLANAQKVALHTLRGLVAAHERGIIHRDIKPGNILVAINGTFKVSDFGLASLADVPSVTAQGMVLGTPAYMSPEQIRHEEVDQRTDLFALGATLIEVLTGERIFEGNSYTDCAKKILAFHTDMLDRFTEQSSAEFVQFLKLLMAPKKQNRFAGSKDALHAFDKRDSNIRVNISRRPSLSKKSRIVLLCGAAALIVGIILFLSKDNFITTRTIQTEIPLKVDSISTPITSDSTGITSNDTHAQTVMEPIQKSPAVKPKFIPPDTMNHAVVDSGTVLLTSTPWAKVYVDDKFIGETPFSRPLSLAAGNHTILFVHPSFDPIMQTITVLPFRETKVTGNFFDNVGYLNCLAIPWAEVYINNEYKDTTPLDKPIMLPPGKYEARFKNSSFKDIVREVTVRSKDTISISISFKDQR
jgi:serine/threonine protein kinase